MRDGGGALGIGERSRTARGPAAGIHVSDGEHRAEAAIRAPGANEAPGATRPAGDARIVFFSGGSALHDLAVVLKRRTANTVHLITPFDSGGSSAELRRAFAMPAVGDLRHRLAALADDDEDEGLRAAVALFRRRLDPEEARARAELAALLAGEDPALGRLEGALARELVDHLVYAVDRLPRDFGRARASVGNLMITGAYLGASRSLAAAVQRFAALFRVRGTVLPTVDAALHLEARLADGTVVRGQHRITGKERPPIASRVVELGLVDADRRPARVALGAREGALIRGADLIVFPMGSFHTSVVANLLPEGVGRAVAASPARKVYVPSFGRDPELCGVGVFEAAADLVRYLRRDAGDDVPAGRLLDEVLLHEDEAVYAHPVDRDRLAALGVPTRSTPLARGAGAERISPERLAAALLARVPVAPA